MNKAIVSFTVERYENPKNIFEQSVNALADMYENSISELEKQYNRHLEQFKKGSMLAGTNTKGNEFHHE